MYRLCTSGTTGTYQAQSGASTMSPSTAPARDSELPSGPLHHLHPHLSPLSIPSVFLVPLHTIGANHNIPPTQDLGFHELQSPALNSCHRSLRSVFAVNRFWSAVLSATVPISKLRGSLWVSSLTAKTRYHFSITCQRCDAFSRFSHKVLSVPGSPTKPQ
jgi:hypothetical protein